MRKERRLYTIRRSLFFSFSTLFSLLLLVSYAMVSLRMFNDKRNEIQQQQLQSCNVISQSIDDAVTVLDTVVRNLQAATDVSQHFGDYITLLYQTPVAQRESNLQLLSKYTSCLSLIQQIVGVEYSKYQVNLYDLRGNSIGTGRFSHRSFTYISDIPFFINSLRAGGEYYVSQPHRLQWLSLDNDKNMPMVSVSRSFKGNDGETIGIIEIATDCGDLFAAMRNFDGVAEIFVYNDLDQCIYPTDADTNKATYYYREVVLNKILSGHDYVCPGYNGSENRIMTYQQSDTSSFSVIMLQPESLVYRAFSNLYFLVPLVLITLGATMLMSYWLSGRMTGSLRKLRENVGKLSVGGILDDTPHLTDVGRIHFEEIDSLTKAFERMNEQLRESVSDLLISKEEELNSKVLAFQAQMNPHFLYNNFANISAMASEGMNRQIVVLCENLSEMMRYIASGSRDGVLLKQELEYARRYYSCIKLRYEDNIDVEWDIDERMMELPIPKLVIQSLLENAVKHGLSTQPPWRLCVRGRIREAHWEITVGDSGLGFDPEQLGIVYGAIENFRHTHKLPELQINGMGLLNIYIRLYLLNGEDTIFRVKNNDGNGCRITIGGGLRRREGEKEG
jgi:two-component system sensor histidine kinase YesM